MAIISIVIIAAKTTVTKPNICTDVHVPMFEIQSPETWQVQVTT